MHYKNGTEAKEGDKAILIDKYSQRIYVGTVHSISKGSESCNCQLATVVPGGTQQICATLGEMYLAEEAFKTMDAIEEAKKATPQEDQTSGV